jgi:hypothetical protein
MSKERSKIAQRLAWATATNSSHKKMLGASLADTTLPSAGEKTSHKNTQGASAAETTQTSAKCLQVKKSAPKVWVTRGSPIMITKRNMGTCFTRDQWTDDKETQSVWNEAFECSQTRIDPQASNNNAGLFVHPISKRLYFAFRTAATHFASQHTEVWALSRAEDEEEWSFEFKIAVKNDLREPDFFFAGTTLFFSIFEAQSPEKEYTETNSLPEFLPKTLWVTELTNADTGKWSSVRVYGRPHEVVWQVTHNDYDHDDHATYRSSYIGGHYEFGIGGYDPRAAIDVFLMKSTDGHTWTPAVPGENVGWNAILDLKTQKQGHSTSGIDAGVVYHGGASEMGFAFHPVSGDIYGVLRNDDGDPNSRWGSRVVYYNKKVGKWTAHPEGRSDPWIHMSPRMFATDEHLWLAARRDMEQPFDYIRDTWREWLPFGMQQLDINAKFSTNPHTTSISWIDPDTKQLVFVRDFHGCGDTGFPSIVKIGPEKYLIINYSNGLDEACKKMSWIEGQTDEQGTLLYVVEISFKKVANGAPLEETVGGKSACECQDHVPFCSYGEPEMINGGFEYYHLALMILPVLVLLCCCAYRFCCRKSHDDDDEKAENPNKNPCFCCTMFVLSIALICALQLCYMGVSLNGQTSTLVSR